MKNSLNSILLYNFQNFTHMVSFNPIVWIFWSKLFLNVQLKWLKEKILYQSKNQREYHFTHMVIKSANTKLINLLQSKIAYYEFNA